MLCPKKRTAILQWFNCVIPFGNVSSLEQLKDGEILRKALEDTLESTGEAVQSSSKSISFIKEGEAEENFAFLQKRIDNSFHLRSEELIAYADCILGKEEELAKVAILVLSIIVQYSLQKDPERLSLLSHLEMCDQVEIMECLSLIFQHSTVALKKAELHRILGRPAKNKEPLRRAIQSPLKFSSTEYVTPKNRGRPPRGSTAGIQSEEETTSPLMKMLSTPTIKAWSVVAAKDREMLALRKELDSAENKLLDQRCEICKLRKDEEKRVSEIKQLKDKFKKMETDYDELMARNLSIREKLSIKNVFQNKTIEMYKMEINLLNTEVNSWKRKTEFANERIRFLEEKDKPSSAQIDRHMLEVQMQLVMAEERSDSCAKEVQKLKEDMKELRESLALYQEKNIKECNESSKFIDAEPENLGNIIDEEYRKAQQSLIEKENENARLVKELEEKTYLCKKLEAKENLDFSERMRALLQPRIKTKGESSPSSSKGGSDEQENSDCANEDQEDVDVFFRALNQIRRLTRDVFTAYLQKQNAEGPDDLEKECPDPAECVSYIQHVLQELLQQIKSASPGKPSSAPCCRCAENQVALDNMRAQLEAEKKAEKEELVTENENLRKRCETEIKLKEKQLEKKAALKASLVEMKKKVEAYELTAKNANSQKSRTLEKYALVKKYVEDMEKKKSLERHVEKNLESKIVHLQNKLEQSETNFKKAQFLFSEERKSKQQIAAQVQLLQGKFSELKASKEALQAELMKEKKKNLDAENVNIDSANEAEEDLTSKHFTKALKNEFFIGIKCKTGIYSPVQKVSSVDANESTLSGSCFNKSNFVADDEEDYLNHSSLLKVKEDHSGRLNELNRRNTLCPPHMRSCYPLETQGYTPNKRALEGEAEEQSKKKLHSEVQKKSVSSKNRSFFKKPLGGFVQYNGDKKSVGIGRIRMKM